MSEEHDAVARTSAALDLAREHLAGRHAEVYVKACIECDRYRLTEELERLRYHYDELKIRLDGWEKLAEALSHHIPEHYEGGYNSLEDWANDAAAVVDLAHAWRKRGRTTEDGDKLDAAVEKIYPSEEYL